MLQRLMSSYVATFLLALFISVTGASGASAATKSEKARSAKQYVTDALQKEVEGLNYQRDELLMKAQELSASCDAARWHSGQVRYHNKWLPTHKVEQIASSSRKLMRYQGLRQKATGSTANQLTLAKWCMKQRLVDQARAHLTQVVQAEPDHAEARKLLGFVRVENDWLSPQEVSDVKQRAVDNRRSFAVWQKKLQRLRDKLLSGSRRQREFAAQQVRDIYDPVAIVALMQILATQKAPVAMLVVEALQNMPGSQASLSLARLAVYSKHDSVRLEAANALRDRPAHDYVPPMLSAMQLPIQSKRELLEGPRGQLVYRQSIERERRDGREVDVTETTYKRVPLPGGSRRKTRQRILNKISQYEEAVETELAVVNQRVTQLNERIMNTLATATGVSLASGSTPETWWHWWNEINEVYVTGAKPVRRSAHQAEVTIVDHSDYIVALARRARIRAANQAATGPVAGDTGPPVTSGNTGPPVTSGDIGVAADTGSEPPRVRTFRSVRSDGLDCLAAGTLVWTETGPVAIESIRVGDRVLSQDPETGELAYKPVLGTTIRPVSQLIRVVVGDDIIQSSGGHLFWAVGKGWQRTRQITAEMAIHGCSGTNKVTEVEQGEQLQSYNLIVADFHTYFIGKTRVLSHDNTPRRPTMNIVPGLQIAKSQ